MCPDGRQWRGLRVLRARVGARGRARGGRKLHLAVAEGRAKQAVPPWQQEARDDEGRRRFHGAFTGGFSAGYFNSVGSKEVGADAAVPSPAVPLAAAVLLVSLLPQWVAASIVPLVALSSAREVQPQRVEALMDADERHDAQRGAVAAQSAFDTFGFTAAERARQLAPAADRRPSVIPEGPWQSCWRPLLTPSVRQGGKGGGRQGEGGAAPEEAGGRDSWIGWVGWLVAIGLAADCWECNVETLSLPCLPVHSTCKALLRRMGWREGRGLGPDEVAASRKVHREGRRAMLALAAGGRGRGEGGGDDDGEAEGDEDDEEGDAWGGREEIVGKGRGARGGKDGGALAAAAAAEAAVAAQLRAPKRDTRGVGFDAFQGAEDVRGQACRGVVRACRGVVRACRGVVRRAEGCSSSSPLRVTLIAHYNSLIPPSRLPPPCLARLSVLWGVGAEHRQRTAGGAREGGERGGERGLGGRCRAGGGRQSLFAAGSGRVAGGFGIGALEEAGAEDEDIYDFEIPAGELHLVASDEDEEGEGRGVHAGGGFMAAGRRGQQGGQQGAQGGAQQGMAWMGGVGRGSSSAVLRGFSPSTLAPPPAPPPADAAVRAAVEGVAAMVARCGAHVEALLLSRAGGGVGEGAQEGMVQGASAREGGGGEGSARLAFLVGGEGSAYYRRRVWELAERQRAAQGRAAAGKAVGSSGGERLGPDVRGALLGEQPLPSSQPAPAPRLSAHPTPTSTAFPAAAASAFTSATSPAAPPAPTVPAFQQHGAAAELAAMMAARFHSSGHEDRAGKGGMSSEKAALPAAPGAGTALAGAAAVVVARRREEAWRPLPLLCKRFNLPDPYAGKAPPPPLHRPSQLDTLTSFPQTLPSTTPAPTAAPTAAPSPLLSLPAPPPAAPAMPPGRDGWMEGHEEGHAIFSDDEDSDDDARATSAAPGGIDDVAAAEAATRALARLEAGDFLEGLGEELGLQVDPGEVRHGAGGEGRREEREGSKGAKRESKAGKGRAGKEQEGGVWGQGGYGAGMAGSAEGAVEAGRAERAREGVENVAGGSGASEAAVGEERQSDQGGSGGGMADAHGRTRGGAMGEGRCALAAAAAVAAVKKKKRVLTSSSSSSASSGSDSDSAGSLSGRGEGRRRRKEGVKKRSNKRSREIDGGKKRRKRTKRRDSGSTGSEESDHAARRKKHKKKASRRKHHRGRHESSSESDGSSSEGDNCGSDSSSERRHTKSRRRHGDKGGHKRRNK
ncbi:unnamed protein product [Closterium sp. NIES-64]|nr:unnamed protein product [Closterium sp. NIES-64]